MKGDLMFVIILLATHQHVCPRPNKPMYPYLISCYCNLCLLCQLVSACWTQVAIVQTEAIYNNTILSALLNYYLRFPIPP